MIIKDFSFGKIFITDASFGHVAVGDRSFAERFSQHFGFNPAHIVWMDQVHSPTVQLVSALSSPTMTLPKTDGSLTKDPRVLLITKTADCVPVLLWNEKEKVIGVLHCGWKGFMAGILESFAQVCQDNNLEIEDFSAYLGPHLRSTHFEVQEDFLEHVPEGKKVFLEFRDGKMFYDLTLGVKTILNSLGLMNIEDPNIDTFFSSEYYSYRGWSQLEENQRPEHYNTFANCIIMT